jgi:hypothetical protein
MENNNDILIYQNKDGKIKLEVRLKKETIWLTINQMAELFGIDKSGISRHLKNIFETGELSREATVANFATVQREGNRNINRELEYYNLDAIISVGYRVNSVLGTQFRIWATQRLKDYIVKGFVLNDDRFKTGKSMQYFDELQQRIREIRLSEKFFYQKIKDIYTTSIDYNPKDEKTQQFFKIVQNKLLWAISQQTAAELVYRRVDASLPLMGMLSLDKESPKSITKQQASIAKNYLNEEEIKLLGLLVEQYLAFAETMAQQQTAMTMQDWSERLDVILQLNGRELLTHAGKISQQQAKEKSAQELEKYREQQRVLEYEESLKEIEADIKRLGVDHND